MFHLKQEKDYSITVHPAERIIKFSSCFESSTLVVGNSLFRFSFSFLLKFFFFFFSQVHWWKLLQVRHQSYGTWVTDSLRHSGVSPLTSVRFQTSKKLPLCGSFLFWGIEKQHRREREEAGNMWCFPSALFSLHYLY